MSSPDSFRDIGTLAGGGQPDAPHLPISTLVEQLVQHAADVGAAQDRLRTFQDGNRRIIGELGLPALLQSVPDVAREVVGTRYAALAVLGPTGHVEQLLHSGLSPAELLAAGEPPKGRGVLALVVEDPVPTRLTSVAAHPQSGGFPVGHPALDTLLSVPVRSRDGLHAVLHLAERTDGRAFTEEDEDLAEALAVTAGIAVDNALVHEDSRRRQEWLRAAAGLTRLLLAGELDRAGALAHTADVVRRLLGADDVAVLVPGPGRTHLEVVAATGPSGPDLVGLSLPTATSLAGRCLRHGQGLHVDLERARHVAETALAAVAPAGPALVLPLRADGPGAGVLLAVRRPRRAPFTQSELDMAETFAGQAAVALQLAERLSGTQRLDGLEQRDGIARELHEQVVQRLFALRADLQETAAGVTDPPVRDRLLRCAEQVEETVRQIRASVFTLAADAPTTTTVGEAVLAVVEELVPVLGLRPQVELVGAAGLAGERPAGAGRRGGGPRVADQRQQVRRRLARRGPRRHRREPAGAGGRRRRRRAAGNDPAQRSGQPPPPRRTPRGTSRHRQLN